MKWKPLLFAIFTLQSLFFIPNQAQGSVTNSVFGRPIPTYLPASGHFCVGLSVLGDSVTLEDGSVWKVASYDSYKVFYWRESDVILVKQNSSWFSNYNYCMTNQTTGASIEVNLFQGPLVNGPYTRYIESIDYQGHLIYLSDGTHWRLYAPDQNRFNRWEVHDAIIIGSSNSWSRAFENILINVSANNFVNASQF